MAVIGDGGTDGGEDPMGKLDDDMAIQVLQYLDSKRDIAHASCVSRAWRSFVSEGQLWKRLCLKEFPELKVFEDVRETALTRDQQAAGSSGSSFKQSVDREERMYRLLLQELMDEPMADKSCIREAVSASSTDNYPEESIVQTLYPRPRYEQTPSYWSSTGQRDVNCPETLTYHLVSPLCVVHGVSIRPFQAFFQPEHPIYSAMHVRIRLGHAIKSTRTDRDSANRKDFVWTYESEKFPMEQVDSVQAFKLPRPVLCIGGVLQVELLGRVQTQQMDQLYYICICHVSVAGRPLSDFRVGHNPGDQSKFWLEYLGRYKENQSGDGANKLLASEGEVPTGTWMSFAERMRQLRAGRILRRNPLLLNSFLGNISVANLLLDQVGPDDSSGDEEVDMEDAEEEADEEEEETSF